MSVRAPTGLPGRRQIAGRNLSMQQPRKEKRQLKQALRQHDPDAARLLLAHSVALGHERLGVRRYLAARYLGAERLDVFRQFCTTAARSFRPEELLKTAQTIARDLKVAVDIHKFIREVMPSREPFYLPFAGTMPVVADPSPYCGEGASVVGRVEIGADPWFGPRAVVRGDGHFVRIGVGLRMGERATVHIAHEQYPALIGDGVVIGRGAVIHACTVGDNCIVEDNVVILDGAVLEDEVIVEAGSTVFPRKTLQSGWVYAGSPACAVREIVPGELELRRQRLIEGLFTSIFVTAAAPRSTTPDDSFVAATASLDGTVLLGSNASVFFGCRLRGERYSINVGANTNIQDNSVIDAGDGPVSIGADSTIGHNVDMRSCIIGARSLIGIGCNLAAGTVIDEDVLLAAGSATEPGQHLESGWLWGGRIARPIARLDAPKRSMMSATIEQYRGYASQYAVAQRDIS